MVLPGVRTCLGFQNDVVYKLKWFWYVSAEPWSIYSQMLLLRHSHDREITITNVGNIPRVWGELAPQPSLGHICPSLARSAMAHYTAKAESGLMLMTCGGRGGKSRKSRAEASENAAKWANTQTTKWGK